MIFHHHNTPIYYTDQGKGPVMIWLHGFLESSSMWHSLAPHFSKTQRIVTLDFPGHGNTPCAQEDHSMEFFASIVATLMEHLHITEATIVGHSMGGYVAMALTELHIEKVETLVLLNSVPSADSEERKRNRERALQLVPNAKDAFISMAITNLFSAPSRDIFYAEIDRAKKEALTFPLVGITKAIKGMKDRVDRTAILKDFSKPKYMICGIHDPIIALSDSKAIANQTNSKLFEVEGSHMNHIENEAEIVKILHFIEKKCL